MSRSIVRLEEVGKRFSGKDVLSRINLEVKEGELLALLGPSGAGKTTLMRIINLFELPSEGKLYFRDREATHLRGNALLEVRRSMVLVFQKPVMFSGRVFDNIAYGLDIRNYSKAEIERRVTEALRLVDLQDYAERNARTLSVGEAQRVAFARAVVIQPEILLLDEPTTSLDPISEAKVHSIISKITDLGISVVLTTHKQEEAISLATRIAVINKGKLEQIGTPEDIFYRPATPFAARFVGAENILEGMVKSGKKGIIAVNGIELEVPSASVRTGEKVIICIRPEEILLLRKNVPPTRTYPNIVEGRITHMSPHGKALIRLLLEVEKELTLKVDIPRHVVHVMKLEVGKMVRASLKPESCHVIASPSSRAFYRRSSPRGQLS